MIPQKILVPMLLLCSAFVFQSCSRTIGYGLVLWAGDESPVETGQIVAVRQESQIQNTYLIRLPGSKELAEIPIWRMRLFAGKEEALDGAEEYAVYQDIYAYSERDGLPLRETRSADKDERAGERPGDRSGDRNRRPGEDCHPRRGPLR